MFDRPMNERPFSHLGRNGTNFSGSRCDLRSGVVVSQPSYITPAQMASDFAEFAAWHALHIHPNLNGFAGYDCIQFHIFSEYPEMDPDRLLVAERTLKHGIESPYDAFEDGSVRTGDWADEAARGVIADLTDRRGIKHEFATVDADVRREMVQTLGDIIRLAKKV